MAENRVKKFLKAICYMYIAAVSLWLLLVFVSYYQWYVVDGSIADFCIHVSTSEFYHFAVSENNACLIDWWPFLKEAVAFPIVLYFLLILPAVAVLLFLQKLEK